MNRKLNTQNSFFQLKDEYQAPDQLTFVLIDQGLFLHSKIQKILDRTTFLSQSFLFFSFISEQIL